MDPLALGGWLREAGLTGVLLFIIWAGHKAIWVWGWYAKKLEAEVVLWRTIALQNGDMAQEATRLAKAQQPPPAA